MLGFGNYISIDFWAYLSLFLTVNYKTAGYITFTTDSIEIELGKKKRSFKLSELTNSKFISIFGIFGDAELQTGIVQLLNTKDGSGNYFCFTHNNVEYIFNLVLEDLKDVRILKSIFQNMKDDYNIKVSLIDKWNRSIKTDYSNL